MELEKPSTSVTERQQEVAAAGAERQARDDDAPADEAEMGAPCVDATDPEPGPRRPLPIGRWGPPRRPLDLSSAEHEELVTRAEVSLRRLLAADNYDSVSNLLALHEAFQSTEEPLYDFYDRYSPPILNKKHTCVGLSLELVRRWRGLGMRGAACLVSCEEAVPHVGEYVAGGAPPASAEKEHSLAAARVTVEGRAGVLLADAGYHVARVLTVMADRAYPHTGWFIQSDEPHCRKEYNYTFSVQNPGYVEWHERETRGNTVKCQTSLIYVARPYLDGVNVTERRNLVYNFRSLLSRDQKGHLIAGLYFPVGARGKDAQFTLFFDNGSEKRKTKHKFSLFLDYDNVPQNLAEDIELCNSQMKYKDGELLSIICKLAKVMDDQSFIDQMLEINEDICRMCL